MTKKTQPHFGYLLVALLTLAGTSLAQSGVQTVVGTPQFGSFNGGPDIINLGNLNAHFLIPIRHKPGRGTTFDYDLTYDSSVWYPVSSGGHVSWQPVSSSSLSGWGGLGLTGSSYIGYSQNNTYGGATPDR